MKFYIDSLKIKNFRCYKEYSCELNPIINVIVGANASGKTSLVEALYVSCMAKSYKTINDQDLVMIGEKEYLVEICAKLVDKNEKNVDKIRLYYNGIGKKIFRFEKQYKTISEYVGFINVIMFCPEDLRIIKGEPKQRRRFLDIYLSQFDRKYLKALMNYNKILKERNELLKDFNDSPEKRILLNTYTEAIIVEAKEIIKKRREFIDKISLHMNENLCIISNKKESCNLIYNANVGDVSNIEKLYKAQIKTDILTGLTTIGPHKDDFNIKINGLDSSAFASQGQQRSLALALKLSLIDEFKSQSQRLIIILDDVFGELDNYRQKDLLKLLKNENQIFITTTETNCLNEEIMKDCNIIHIKKEGDLNG